MSEPTAGLWREGILRDDERAAPRGCVVKFGGSLLLHPDWPELLVALARRSSPADPWTFVVGGGPVVDGLRTIDGVRRGCQEEIHRLAIDAMGITARLVAATSGLPIVPTPPDPERTSAPPGEERRWAVILDMASWIAARPGSDADLPRSWEVTSDSLAAMVAGSHGLGLVLAKRVPPPGALPALAASGWVDPCFIAAARDVGRIGWVAPAR